MAVQGEGYGHKSKSIDELEWHVRMCVEAESDFP
jgi:hypothetical protein